MTKDALTDTTQHTLDASAVSLPGVLMQAITHIAPAVGLIFTVQAISGVAGIASPFALAFACLAMATVSVSVIQLSKKISSAGGYFTWVGSTIGPRAGFFVAWIFLLFEPIGAGINLAFLGGILESTLKAEFGFRFAWWIPVLIGIVLLTVVSYYGLKLSIQVVVLLGAFEIIVCVALALTGLLQPGPGGVNLIPFDPSNASSFNGLFLGIVFSIFAFAGFEQVAPLAEESRDPARTLPRAVVLSLLISGVFFLFTSWGIIIGWGTDDLSGFVSDGSPVLTLAHRLWGVGWILLLITLINSAVGVGIAVQNASTRVIYGMARAGALPAPLAKIHPVRRTPVNAVWTQSVVTAVVALGGGALFGPVGVLSFAAIIITLLVIVVYSAGNLAMWRLYSRRYPQEYNRLTHLAIPIFSTIVLLYVGYKTVSPLPEGINGWAPVVAVAWFVAGLLVVAVLSRTGRGDWMARIGRAIAADDGSQAERAGTLSDKAVGR
ncbi:APC family permease [Nonomuraea antimicrobica]|uniref:APC family permease n=1 Tax=Nonomuraea antimicrobica TaxID=561173 RepID=A0ABP7D2E9_9ACTN